MSGTGPEAAACVTPQDPARAHRRRTSISMSFDVKGEGA
ncbi:Uncharacterised protein [Nocardia africana]|uniref:Uncharacterized protein n=1 Tax=Nocardia africana TaxID=134964 RepID=A0A378WXD7_9NOCA|nr:Uncharacterised protein [Nocardia africana]